ncbi:MAG TPA: amino acid adenylation domain-containing protein, partial [Terracidiphilus sp.]
LVEWNATPSEPRAKSLPEWFEARVEQTPDAIAVEDEQSEVSYAELNRRANRLARHLRGLGVGPERLVGICSSRSQAMMVALLAVLKAGGAYVPLDPAYPQERLRYMLQDSGVEVLLTEQGLLAGLPPHPGHTICLDRDERQWAEQSGENLGEAAQAANLAYVIYTSGSTGKPKGVQISQGALVNLLGSMQQEPGLGSEDRLLAVTTLSFDIAALELFLPLLTGARLVLASGETARDGVRLQGRLREAGITVMQATPATWRLLLETGWTGDGKLRIWCGGEALGRDLAEQLLLRCGALWNMYGPTETTIWSAVERIESGTGPVRIGLPVANTEFYVLDGNLQLLPVGVVGELHIGGRGLARGYLRQEELTAQKFIAHPFSAQAGSRLYKTGDLVRRMGDGRLEFLGRLDEQVKVRGFRIELGEIESALSQHAGVKAAVVEARVDGLQEKQLVAYVVPQGTVAAEDLRTALRQRLPEYMVPSQFVFLSSLPLTPNGKVNRRALPGPEPAGTKAAEKRMPPRDAREKKLAEIWAAVLGVSPIGIHDNFFDLGGHSLLAAKLISSIEKVMGERLSLADVFRTPTIAQMASLLRQQEQAQEFSGIIPIQPQGSKPPLFWVRGAALFLALARRLGLDQPSFGLHLPAAEASQLSRRCTLEEIAGAFVQKMRQVQPEGPYHLAGLCVNGVLAYEMARQLTAAGQEVALLVMFDAQNPVYYRDYSPEGLYNVLSRRIAFHLQKMKDVRASDLGMYVGERWQGVRRRWNRARWHLAYERGWRAQEDLQNLDRIVHPAAEGYRPRSYDGRVVLFQSTDWPEGQYWDLRLGWSTVAPRLEYQRIEGAHEAIFHEDNVDAFALKLTKCLRDARTVISPPPSLDFVAD